MTKNAATIALLTALNNNAGHDLSVNNAMRIITAMQAHLNDDVQQVAVCTHDLDALREAAKGGDHDALVAYARVDAEIAKRLDAREPIHAIKVLRLATNAGLKEAKDAIDALTQERRPNNLF